MKAPLGTGISHVLLVCTREKVIWPHASAIVALMTKLLPYWDITAFSEPSILMSPETDDTGFAPNSEAAVTSFSYGSHPYPTVFSFLDLQPKPLSDSFRI
jgi:hypothetical protein